MFRTTCGVLDLGLSRTPLHQHPHPHPPPSPTPPRQQPTACPLTIPPYTITTRTTITTVCAIQVQKTWFPSSSASRSSLLQVPRLQPPGAALRRSSTLLPKRPRPKYLHSSSSSSSRIRVQIVAGRHTHRTRTTTQHSHRMGAATLRTLYRRWTALRYRCVRGRACHRPPLQGAPPRGATPLRRLLHRRQTGEGAGRQACSRMGPRSTDEHRRLLRARCKQQTEILMGGQAGGRA